MKEFLCCADRFIDAYHLALKKLYLDGDESDCGDWGCKQKELSMTIHVERPLAEPRISKLFIGGPKELEQYRQEILYGILDFEVEKGNWTYTYHDRMVNWSVSGVDQIEFVVKELKRNPSSRRAVMVIRDVPDIRSNDPACLQHIQYFIRNGKLDCVVTFRSNDAVKATFMNAFALICLQERIAKKLDIPVGTYTHRANSFHCYEKDYPLLYKYYERICNFRSISDVAYYYEDEWKDIMEEMQPLIVNEVAELRKR